MIRDSFLDQHPVVVFALTNYLQAGLAIFFFFLKLKKKKKKSDLVDLNQIFFYLNQFI